MTAPHARPDLAWRPNWIATCFAGAQCRTADGGDPVSQDSEAEMTILHVIQECPDGCSAADLLQKVRMRLDSLGYRPLIYNAWLDERQAAAWEIYRKMKEAGNGESDE